MARNAAINIKINTRSGQKSIDKLNGTVGQTEEKTRKLTEELRDMRDELARLDKGTQEFQELEFAAGELAYEINNVNQRIKVLSSDQLALDKTIGVVQGMAGAYQSVLGVTALLGVENEQLLEILVKMQAVQSVVNGLNQVSAMLSERTAAGIALRNIQTKILNSGLVAQTTVTNSANIATKALDASMRALPIFAVIAGLTALVYGISRVVGQSKEAAARTEELRLEQEELAKAAEDMRKSIASESAEFVGLIYQLKSTNEGSKERLDLINQINATYGTTLSNLKDEIKFQNQLTEAVDKYIDSKIREAKLEATNEEFKALLQERFKIEQNIENLRAQGFNTLRARSDYEEKVYQDRLAEIQRLKDEQDLFDESKNVASNARIKQIEEEIEADNKLRDANYVRLMEIDEQLKELGFTSFELSQSVSKTVDKVVDKTDDLMKAYIDANTKYFDAIEADRISRIEDSREKELQTEADKYDNLIQLAEAAGMDTVEITEKYQDLIIAINNKYDEEARNNKIKLNNETLILQEQLLMQEEINLAESEEERINIRNKYADRIRSLKINELNDERDILLQNTELTEEERNKIIAEYALKNAKLMEESITPSEDVEEEWWETMEGILSVASSTLGEIGNLTNALFDQMAQNLENETNMRMKSYDDQALSFATSLENQEISREEYDAKMKNLDIAKEMEERNAKRKAFEQDKKTRITSAIMGIAQGVIAGLGAPFPMNIVMPALAAVTGGIQLGVIKSQQFKAATGGIVPGQPSKVDSVDARLAPGEAVINSTSTAMFGPLLSQLNQIGGGKSLLPNTELKQEPTNSSFNREHDVRAYVTWSDIDQKNREDSRYRRNGRV